MKSKINKTLGELLQEEKYQKCNLKIGSKGGSSFWYCGSGKLSYALPQIEKAFESVKRNNMAVLNKLHYRYKHIDKIYNDLFKEKEKAKEPLEFEKYKTRMLRKKEKEIEDYPNKVASLEYDIENGFLGRPVLEVLKGISRDEDPCYIVYVKGNEKGAYWTIKEYLKRHKGCINE